MTGRLTDRIWTTRPGVSPLTAGDPCDFLTIVQIANGLPNDTILATQVSWASAFADPDFVAAVIASETDFTSVSSNGSISITPGGVNGHAPNFGVVWSSAPAAAIAPSAVNWSTAGADAAFVSAVSGLSPVFAATSSNGSVIITAGGVAGHAPNLAVSWGAAPADAINPTSINWTLSAGDVDFTAAVRGQETAFAASSANGSVIITAGGTNGHAPGLAVNWASVPVNALSPLGINWPAAAGDPDFLAAVSASETDFAATSPDGTITIAASGISGHSPGLSVAWANAPANAINPTAISWLLSAADPDFATAAAAGTAAAITPAQADTIASAVRPTGANAIASNFGNDAVPFSAVNFNGAAADTDFAAAVAAIAPDTPFAAISSNGTINIVSGGTNGHAPNLSVVWNAAPQNSIDVRAIEWALAGADADYRQSAADASAALLSGAQVDLIARRMSDSGADWIAGQISQDALPHTAVDFAGAETDVEFQNAVDLAETVTSLTYDPANTLLIFQDENRNNTVVNLSALTTDLFIGGASFAGTVLTLTNSDPSVPNIAVDLAGFASTYTDNGDGTYLLESGDGSSLNIDARASGIPITDAGGYFVSGEVETALQELGLGLASIAAETVTVMTQNPGTGQLIYVNEANSPVFMDVISTQAGNLITVGADAGAYINQAAIQAAETITTISQAVNGQISYTDEDLGVTILNVIAIDAGNLISAGANRGALLKAPTTHLP